MQVIPAIDLRGGLCVRLRQGDYDRETVFGDDPEAMATRWEAEGAARIHLVDLDGAKAGHPVNVEAVRSIVKRVSAPCQLGGGVRDRQTIATWLEAGLERVIVGTQALRDPGWFRAMIEEYPGRLVLGLDARDGHGRRPGLAGDFGRDGHRPGRAVRQSSPGRRGLHRYRSRRNTSGTESRRHRRTGRPPQDARDRLWRRGHSGGSRAAGRLALAGCIVGRALYEGVFTLAAAIACGREATSKAKGCLPESSGGASVQSGGDHSSKISTRSCLRIQSIMSTTYHISDIRNVALAGHGASGKTSLADALLFAAGAIARKGSVDEGTSTLDIDDEEKRRHFTIDCHMGHLAWNGKQVHLIDSPGYPDFIGNALSALAAVENVVLAISGPAGIEVNTRRLFQEARKMGLGRFIAITKMDAENVDYKADLEAIRETFGLQCVPFNVPSARDRRSRGFSTYSRTTRPTRPIAPCRRPKPTRWSSSRLSRQMKN